MKIPFTKMHGAGNDYIYVNCLDGELKNPEKLAKEMSRRRFSVGADGLVLICPSEKADAKMRMFNADGSEGNMCGNAIRCVGKYLYDNKITNKTALQIETRSGIKNLKLNRINNELESVTVAMGKADFAPGNIPVAAPSSKVAVTVCGTEYALTCVSMGNPHAVCFLEDIQKLDLEKIGPLFENNPLFPERVNTEFVKQRTPDELEMRVWERGSGETFACGTGACAAVAAAVANGRCKTNTEIAVKLAGGTLKILCDNEKNLFMTGNAIKVYDGVYMEDNV